MIEGARWNLVFLVLTSCASAPDHPYRMERPTSADIAALNQAVTRCGLQEGAFSFVEIKKLNMVVIRAEPRLEKTDAGHRCFWNSIPEDLLMRFGAENNLPAPR